MTQNGYRFSPLADEAGYKQALAYIATQAALLSSKVLGRELPIDTLTLFAHYEQEYEFLEKLIRQVGPVSPLSHGATLYVETDITVGREQVKTLGVRRPDPYRRHVGYADFPTTNFETVLLEHQGNPLLRPTKSGAGIDLLEIWHPDFDILGYIISSKDRR